MASTMIDAPNGDKIRIRVCGSHSGCVVVEKWEAREGWPPLTEDRADDELHLPSEVIPEVLVALTKARDAL